VAGECERRVALPVALEGPAAAVVLPAVGLDDDALLGEEEVDLEAGDRVVHTRLWQIARATEGEHALLELASGERRAGDVVGERPAQTRGAAVAGTGVGDRGERLHVGESEDLHSIENPLERTFAAKCRREVEDRPGRAGDRDAARGRGLVSPRDHVRGGRAARARGAGWDREP